MGIQPVKLKYGGYYPGAEKRIDLIDINLINKCMKFAWLIQKWHRAELHNHENIPKRGGALIVTNHGRMAYDAIALGKLIYDKTERIPRGLTFHEAWRVPYWRELMLKVGAVDGNKETAVNLLRSGELAFTVPGGVRDIYKSRKQKHTLCWENRFGFIKVALQAQAPIIPIVGIGNDGGFIRISNGFWISKITKPLRKLGMPTLNSMGIGHIGLPIQIGLIPIPMPYPFQLNFPVKLDYYVGKPIQFNLPPEASENESVVRTLQKQVWDIMNYMFSVCPSK